ncbi:hypothetical protein V1288_005306 [Bradyrhizobium sp. AZCC 2176]
MAPKAVAGGSGMTITQRDRDLGTGYAMKPSTTRTELTSVGRGTPMGELLRRYWHPVGLVADATDRLDAADRRHDLPHLCRGPREEFGRHRTDALQIQRQVLVGHDRTRAPAISRRLRSAGRPGPVTLHSEEHFGQSDRGILMIRRMLSDQLEAIAAGRDPIGVSFDSNAAPVEFEAGNFIREA